MSMAENENISGLTMYMCSETMLDKHENMFPQRQKTNTLNLLNINMVYYLFFPLNNSQIT